MENSVIKMIMNSVCTLMFVSCSIDFQDGVNNFDVGVNESLFFSLYADPNGACECPKVLLMSSISSLSIRGIRLTPTTVSKLLSCL